MRIAALVLSIAVPAAGCGNGGGASPGSGGGAIGDGGPGSHCRSNVDCSISTPCARLEDPQCGGFDPHMCQSDMDCADAGPDQICFFDGCGGSRCTGKCTSDAQCPSIVPGATACATATGQCVAKPCSQPSDCPTNYSCTAGSCAVTKCTHDGDCQGYCVNGFCSKALGTCTPPAG